MADHAPDSLTLPRPRPPAPNLTVVRVAGPIPTSRVLVISPFELVRCGLLLALADMDDVVATGQSSIDNLPPEAVVVYDVRGLELDGPGDLDRLCARRSLTVLALDSAGREHLTRQALDLGVDGLVSWESSGAAVAAALDDARRGRFQRQVAAGPCGHRDDPGDDCSVLSSREREVLGHIASGWSNDEIARTMFLSINTIKTYIRNAYRRIEVQSRTQAVVWSRRHDIGGDPAHP